MTHDPLIFDASAGRHALRRILRKLHSVFLVAAGEESGEGLRAEAYRASGDCVCSGCGTRYGDHPQDPWAPWLNVLCDGRRVKL